MPRRQGVGPRARREMGWSPWSPPRDVRSRCHQLTARWSLRAIGADVVGGTIGIGIILVLWVPGSVILGLFTRGKRSPSFKVSLSGGGHELLERLRAQTP